jgi:hypothetical protein
VERVVARHRGLEDDHHALAIVVGFIVPKAMTLPLRTP